MSLNLQCPGSRSCRISLLGLGWRYSSYPHDTVLNHESDPWGALPGTGLLLAEAVQLDTDEALGQDMGETVASQTGLTVIAKAVCGEGKWDKPAVLVQFSPSRHPLECSPHPS